MYVALPLSLPSSAASHASLVSLYPGDIRMNWTLFSICHGIVVLGGCAVCLSLAGIQILALSGPICEFTERYRVYLS